MLMKALDTKYSMSVLLFVSEKGQCFKKDLYSVVTSPNTLDKLLDSLQDAGLIAMKEEIRGRRTYLITLTATGKRVTKKLKEIDGILSK
jgi:DNA-binding MarR family transcriptional regulator